MTEKFWETKRLDELTDEEWESLCDGCAQCCRVKFQDKDSGQLATTTLVCHLLDIDKRRCTRYPQRHQLVPACIELDAENVLDLHWLPETCGYRRVAERKPLEDWHPLISGKFETVYQAGISVSGQVISVDNVHPDDIAYHLLKWVEEPSGG